MDILSIFLLFFQIFVIYHYLIRLKSIEDMYKDYILDLKRKLLNHEIYFDNLYDKILKNNYDLDFKSFNLNNVDIKKNEEGSY